MASKMRWFDPLYGACELSTFEASLVRCPEVQRLRYVRMCNINSMLIAGASEISRFEHSLGVLRLTQQWMASRPVPETMGECLRAAALLHDVLTAPFGHSLQYVFEDNPVAGEFRHDDILRSREDGYYQRMDANASFAGRPFAARRLLGNKWSEVTSLIKGQGAYGPLISGTMDLDNIDNVIRLAFHVGIVGDRDRKIPQRLATSMDVVGGNLVVGESVLEDITRWQDIRSTLYSLLLLDWAEFSAKAMLTRVVEQSVASEMLGADSWKFTDLELLYHVEQMAKGVQQDVGELSRRLRGGELYYPVVLSQSSDVDSYYNLSGIATKRLVEHELEQVAKGKLKAKCKLIFHPILDRKKTNRSVDVIVRESGDALCMGVDSSRLLLGLFSSAELSKKDAVQLRAMFNSAMDARGVTRISDLEDPVVAMRANAQIGMPL